MFEQEKEILLSRGFQLDPDRFAADKHVAFRGSLAVDPERELIVSFSNGFPSFAPTVCDTGSSPLLRRHHHPGTRELCLFGPRSIRWYAALTSTDVLAEATQLLTTFGSGSHDVEGDEIPEPASAVLPYRQGVAILVPPPISSIEPDFEKELQGQFFLRCEHITNHPRLRAQGLVFSAAIGGRSTQADSYYKALFDRRGSLVTGPVIYVRDTLSGEQLIEEVKRRFATPNFKRERWFCVLFREQTGNTGATRLAWLFVRQTTATQCELIETFTYRESDRSTRIPALKNMNTKKVTMIGGGCLGSKIAVALVASGVRKIALIDRERYEPNNAVRHEVEVQYFGVPKVTALAERLANLNPEAEVLPIFSSIGAANSQKEEGLIIDAFADSDTIIDTTGSHAVSRWVNERCFSLGVPGVFVSVTNGAWAGEVVRIIPGETACWLCWNAQYHDDPPPAEPMAGVFPPGCGQPSFTGSTFDAGIVANLGTTIIAATLLRDAQETRGIGGDYLRWIGRNAEGDYILRADIRSITKRDGCALCNPC